MIITNKHNLPLSIGVWLMRDEYDYDPTAISATSLLKPLKQMILSGRAPTEALQMDLSDMIASRMGTALHSAIEQAWEDPELTDVLEMLHLTKETAANFVINPATLEEGQIPIYMEQRVYGEVEGQKISGKYDFISGGVLEDFKSTSVYSYLLGDKEEKFAQQGSIYRYLDPEKITEDYMRITYIFTDWQKSQVAVKENYPTSRVKSVEIPLMDITETEEFIGNKIRQIRQFKHAPESALPRCSDEELWRKPAVYKYYSNPDKTTGRSTKNFGDLASAYQFKAEKGKGVVIEVKGQVIACRYCRGAVICEQKNEYLLDGSLILDEV